MEGALWDGERGSIVAAKGPLEMLTPMPVIQIKGIDMEAEFGPHMLYITNEDKPRAKTTLATVLNIWGALKPQIEAEGGETVDQTVEDMQRIVDLALSSVQRTRPADADKAVRFLNLVIQSQQ